MSKSKDKKRASKTPQPPKEKVEAKVDASSEASEARVAEAESTPITPRAGANPARGVRQGWNTPKPDAIPRGTFWPAGMAMAITFFGWGFVTSKVVLAIGFALFVVCLAGWIGEIRHERREREI